MQTHLYSLFPAFACPCGITKLLNLYSFASSVEQVAPIIRLSCTRKAIKLSERKMANEQGHFNKESTSVLYKSDLVFTSSNKFEVFASSSYKPPTCIYTWYFVEFNCYKTTLTFALCNCKKSTLLSSVISLLN